jgi:uncharacterized CHY-type Zn-finger protein
MTAAFVLGNGVSRQAVDLAALYDCGTVYGCNAIYREFTPHVLISTDAQQFKTAVTVKTMCTILVNRCQIWVRDASIKSILATAQGQ